MKKIKMITVVDLTYKQYLEWEAVMEEVGVKYINGALNYDCFEVLDEQKLLIGTIKYGLKYEVVIYH